jgi:hypothetical protein
MNKLAQFYLLGQSLEDIQTTMEAWRPEAIKVLEGEAIKVLEGVEFDIVAWSFMPRGSVAIVSSGRLWVWQLNDDGIPPDGIEIEE